MATKRARERARAARWMGTTTKRARATATRVAGDKKGNGGGDEKGDGDGNEEGDCDRQRELASLSRRVLGPEHVCTKKTNELDRKTKKRHVSIANYGNNFYQAIRYKNDGEVCVVAGPIITELSAEGGQQSTGKAADNARICHVPNGLILPGKSCAVMCHGLVSASHLNGKLGDVRGALENNITRLRLMVHFEDKNLMHVMVKSENLRIVLELPSRECVHRAQIPSALPGHEST
jgi:hypothetical protein